MNYKPLVISKLKEFTKEFPDYSIGEIIYSMFANSQLEGDIKKRDLLNINDDQFYTMIERAIQKEHQPED